MQMEMPRPSPEQQALEIMTGDWLGDEHIQPGPFDPVGGPAIGRTRNRMALDGFAIIQDYEQERNGATNFRGHGVFRWDAAESCYMLHWFDSMGFPPSTYRGTLINKVLTLMAPKGEGKVRATWDFSTPGRIQYKQEVSPDGAKWFVFMEGEYARQ
jgi:hypothetical protein